MSTNPVPDYWRNQGIEQVLIDEESIARRVRELGAQLSIDCSDGEGIVLLVVLSGAVVFAADLMRAISVRLAISMVGVASYGSSVTSKGAILTSNLPKNLQGKHVIIVDEVLDSGGTLRLLREELEKVGVASLRACVLLRKQREQALSTKCELIGFDIPDVFVVGYGLDFNEEFRNIPFVGVLGQDGIHARSAR